MDIASAVISLAGASSTAGDEGSIHPHAALLEDWRRNSGQCPRPESFTPTTEEPFFTAKIGEIGGAPVYAYGIRRVDTVLSGPQLRSASLYYEWTWYFDRDHANAYAVLESFRRTEEAYTWHVEEYRPPKQTAHSNLCEFRIVNGVRIYRVVTNDSGWGLCTEHDVCRLHHPGLRDLNRPLLPDFPAITDAWEVEIPKIREYHAGQCGYCCQAIQGFLTPYLPDRGWRPDIKSVATREEAEKLRARVVEYIAEQRKECLDRESAKLDEQLKMGVLVGSNKLREDPLYEIAKPEFDKSQVAEFDRLRDLGLDAMSLDEATELENVTRLLAAALEAYKTALTFEITEHGLIAKLRALLLKHLPCCPVCKGDYDRGDEILLEMLRLGYGRLKHTCPRYSYEPGAYNPEILEEFHALKHWMRSDQGLKRYGSYYKLVRIEIGGRPVVTAALEYSEHVAFFIDREVLKTASSKPVPRFVWAQSKADAIDKRDDQREQESKSGDVLKLKFYWSDQYRNWSCHRDVPTDGGMAHVVYVVHADAQVGMTQDWYYCRQTNPDSKPDPKRSITRIGIRPICRVPDRHVPKTAVPPYRSTRR